MNEHLISGLAIVAAVLVVVMLAVTCSEKEARECHKAGGHMHSLYKSSVCLSPDGRILEP